MATDLIEEYLLQLRRSLHDRPGTDDICAEVEDHLREATARLVLRGVPPGEAQQRTLASFGTAGLVARSFRSAAPDAAVPSRSSRLAGSAALVAAAAWAASTLLGVPEMVHDGVFDAGPWWYFAWASAALAAALATTVAVVGMLVRGGRQRSASAFIAWACCAVGAVGLALFTWGWSLGALFLTAAVALGCAALRGAGLTDRVRDVLLIAAWPTALVMLLVGDDVLGLGEVDSYGDHPLASVVAYMVGALMFAAGLYRLGGQLRAESVTTTWADPARAIS
jgi:hypothetical protein